VNIFLQSCGASFAAATFVLLCHAKPYYLSHSTLSYHILSYLSVVRCYILSYNAIPYPAMPCPILVSVLRVALSSSSMPCYLLPFILTHGSYGVIQIAGGHSACHKEHRGSCDGHVPLPQISSIRQGTALHCTAHNSTAVHSLKYTILFHTALFFIALGCTALLTRFVSCFTQDKAALLRTICSHSPPAADREARRRRA
jgi:hypothetical protein